MGVFSICSPIRPNPIGMSVLEVLGIRGSNISVRRLDMLDGTPILDIKPYMKTGVDRGAPIMTNDDTGGQSAVTLRETG